MAPVGDEKDQSENDEAEQTSPMFLMQQFTFRPGPLGLSFIDGGIVTAAPCESQAGAAGVEPGWFVIKVMDTACEGGSKKTIENLFKEAKKIGADYTVTFAMLNQDAAEADGAVKDAEGETEVDAVEDAAAEAAEAAAAAEASSAHVRATMEELVAVRQQQEAGEDVSERLLQTRAKLARALFDDGKHAEGMACQRKLLADIGQPRESPAMLDAYLGLALMAGESGKHKEALTILRNNAELHRRNGENLPFSVAQALAWNLTVLGGEAKLDQAYDILTTALQEQDAMEASERHNMKVMLANLYNQWGHYEDELKLRQEILDVARKDHGDNRALLRQVEKQLRDTKGTLKLKNRGTSFFRLVITFGVLFVAWWAATQRGETST